MRYVLGVDGGNSKTHALVVDESGRVLGFGKSGASNHQTRGMAAALKDLKKAVHASFDAAGLPNISVDLGCFCLAGADLPEDYAMLQKVVEELALARQVVVKNDCLGGLRAGLSRSWGVVVNCGTGFNAAGRAQNGREYVLPGLGPISGDWGGGGELSEEMIRLVMRAWDGRGQPTLLTRLVLEALQAPNEEALLSSLYHNQIDHSRILNLTPLLFEAADSGDTASQALIIRLGVEVGVTAVALMRRLGLEAEATEVVLMGGVFKGKGSLLIDTVTRLIHEQTPKACVVRPRYEPVVGAALLALEALSITVDEALHSQFVETLPKFLVIPAS